MIASLLIQFVSRTVFIHYLGKDFLGINGLYSSILGVLSFAELGIGTAMNFSLYKPVAEGNIEKIKSYMYCYKWAYRIIAVIIAALGLCLLPFLNILVKDPGNVGNIKIYYMIFLFNTVTSYFVSYKYSLVNAEQRNYIYTNINLLISLTTTIIQIISLVLWHNYLVYLLVAAVFGVGQKLFISIYLDRLHPYLKEKDVQKLTKEEFNQLITKVKALIMHKLGEVCVHQTDNIIISAFLNVGTVGLLSNYTLIISTISSYVGVLFQSVTGSLGNLIATESTKKQYEIFKVYRFIGFWFYGFTSIALMTLLSPFIRLWVGDTMVVSDFVIFLILVDYYMIGHRICLNNFKMAGGVFEKDKYVAIVQSVVNLVASVALVKYIGLPGVYIGTILQGLISTVVKPIIVYKSMFGISSKYYFYDSVKYGLAVLGALLGAWSIRCHFLTQITVWNFLLTATSITILINLVFGILFHKNKEFMYIINTAKQFIRNYKK